MAKVSSHNLDTWIEDTVREILAEPVTDEVRALAEVLSPLPFRATQRFPGGHQADLPMQAVVGTRAAFVMR